MSKDSPLAFSTVTDGTCADAATVMKSAAMLKRNVLIKLVIYIDTHKGIKVQIYRKLSDMSKKINENL